ncbi:MAG: sugar transporter permease [Myxococcales bacterium]|jgi:alpha-glucoside transport system permease protein|nr:sugar transporter permease [Myxococcales bacterium]
MTTSSMPVPAGAPTTTEPAEAPKQTRARRRSPRLKQGQANWVVKIVLLVICLLWVVPTIGLFVTSFRTADAVNSSGWWTVFASPFDFTQWTLDNYRETLFPTGRENGMANAFLNSLVVAVPSTVIPILIAAFAAYAFTFMRFKGRDTLFVLIVALLVVPNQVALVPLLQVYGSLGLNGTFLAVWLAHAGFGMPLAIFILRGYMQTLPRSVIESASVDGASHFTTFWRLIIPMSVPALAAFAIFQFLWTWNDLLIALLFIGAGPNEVVQVNLAANVGGLGQGWQLLTAGAFVSMIVPLLVFIGLQRYFVRGLTAGSVKG